MFLMFLMFLIFQYIDIICESFNSKIILRYPWRAKRNTIKRRVNKRGKRKGLLTHSTFYILHSTPHLNSNEFSVDNLAPKTFKRIGSRF
ncbi:hypothetical protein F5Y11DRAFT_27070 [Daldinia sp. FL1419]|nr:hypothetical protein F5Y11DRAFT_27070 [Daldinia sp. FL1419]